MCDFLPGFCPSVEPRTAEAGKLSDQTSRVEPEP